MRITPFFCAKKNGRRFRPAVCNVIYGKENLQHAAARSLTPSQRQVGSPGQIFCLSLKAT